jgi:hypothetical protein
MQKTWKPLAVGILDIVAGLLGVFSLIRTLQFFGFFYSLPICIAEPDCPMSVMTFSLILVAVSVLAVDILAIVGGICALRRKKWGVALAGSIAACFCAAPLGIAAIILTVLSKNEFEQSLDSQLTNSITEDN